ncbi:uncharacterized protein METZ01_LOCUS398558, partial [marine metagenome]
MFTQKVCNLFVKRILVAINTVTMP